MDAHGLGFDEALATATELGYAEADPTADIEGYDAAQKAAILASLAFHTRVPVEAVHREGITGLSSAQFDSARKAGYVIKLLAICERLTDPATGRDGVSARVYPALVPRDHPLAAVHGANNAVFVEAEAAGDLMFYGAGAGGVQTASAVLGDVVSAARRHVVGGPGVAESAHADLETLPVGAITTQYQITLQVADEPGVLARIAHLFSEHGVSVETLEQTTHQAPVAGGAGDRPTASLVIGTHRATDAALRATVDAVSNLDAVTAVASVLRVEGA
ncbi:Homoserine dehydrogenase [Clavibacter michiganensis]|uniref:Homoserine dehydrogenase n=2 Tax=Clavibacter michiganensis TaxID=28447 RepID=A0A251XS94_9MICO|nr:Homoserine dehydrogenase [Clavibacter michiganensis]